MSNRSIDPDLARLRRLLAAAAARADVSALAAKPEVSILDVACGACDEAGTLSDLFATVGRGADATAAKTLVVGTDVRERELGEARRRFAGRPGREFEFFKGDASKLRGHRQLREEFDVVFFRHQNLFNGRQLWHRIFEQAVERMTPDGLLIITSYFDREHDLALKAFDKVGADLVTSLRNPDSRALETPGKSVDRHVAVLRRRGAGPSPTPGDAA